MGNVLPNDGGGGGGEEFFPKIYRLDNLITFFFHNYYK